MRKCCPACCGIGSHLARKWVRDDSGVSIYKNISVRRACGVCGGTGRIEGSETLHTHFCNTRGVRRVALPGVGSPPKPLERGLGYFLFIVLVSYAWFLVVKEHNGAGVWPKIAITLAASLTLLAVLRRFPATSRSLRWGTLAFFLIVVCGGVALEIVRH